MSDDTGLPTSEEIYQSALERLEESARREYDQTRYVLTADGMVAIEPEKPWISRVVEHVSKVLNHAGLRQVYRRGGYRAMPGWMTCRRQLYCSTCDMERRAGS